MFFFSHGKADVRKVYIVRGTAFLVFSCDYEIQSCVCTRAMSSSDVMVFEDAGSLGSAISGQQSPEPADQSKSSAEDGGGGTTTTSTTGSVLGAGTVLVKRPCRKENSKKLLWDRSSIFSMSRVTSRSSGASATTTVVPGAEVVGRGDGCNSSGVVNPSPSSITTKTATTTTSTLTQDPSRSLDIKTNAVSASTATSTKSGVSWGSNNNTKPSRRTTSLLNLFVASTSLAGMWLVSVPLHLMALWQHVARLLSLSQVL